MHDSAGASGLRPKRLTTRYANCPLCDSSLSPANACKHFEEERERFSSWYQNVKKNKRHARFKKVKENMNFKNVRARRNERCLAIQEKLKPWLNAACPLCAKEFSSGASEVFEHIYSCQNAAVFRQDVLNLGENQVDIDSTFRNDEPSNLETILQEAEITSATIVRLSNGDQDVSLDVETLDEEEFGQEQYSKHDIDLMRESVQVGHELPESPGELCYSSTSQNSSSAVETRESLQSSTTSDAIDDSDNKPGPSVVKAVYNSVSSSISSHKAQLNFTIQGLMRDSTVCAVCMGPYKTPLASISCWHVLCEECWLRALAVSKLCPLCKDIISPGKLRKLFI